MKNKKSATRVKSDHLKSLKIFENRAFYEDTQFSEIHCEEGSEIIEAEFYDCTFNNCKCFGISFTRCIFENCQFQNCDLGSIAIKNSSFRDVRFTDTKLTGVQWADASTPLDVNFSDCLLNYGGFINVDLRNAEITHCQCKGADFTEANLTKANCRNSDFSEARFVNTDLTRANFTNATNYAIHPDGNRLCKTKFSAPEVLSLLDVFDIIIE